MGATPLGMTPEEITELCKLVQQDMTHFLGYEVIVAERSRAGQDVRPRLYGLQNKDYNDRVRDKFSECCYNRMLEIKKVFNG